MAEAEKKKSDLIPRVVTAVVAIPLLLALFLYAPAWAFLIVIAIAGGISAWEYCNITIGDEMPAAKWLMAALTSAIIAVMYFYPQHLLPTVLGASITTFLFILFAHEDQPRATHHLGSSITSLVYAGLMFGCIALLRQKGGDVGHLWVIMGLAIVWGSDTGAYFAGRALGKHKLYPSVSPNKTIEGALGGVVTSVLFTFGFDAIFQATNEAWVALEIWQVFLLAIPANLLAQTGDLCESLVKRAHKVKDSGTIIYGHGGMLDRIDALIFASPWFYYFVLWFTSHGANAAS
jgi:phosphatidate cytidylyltransferase